MVKKLLFCSVMIVLGVLIYFGYTVGNALEYYISTNEKTDNVEIMIASTTNPAKAIQEPNLVDVASVNLVRTVSLSNLFNITMEIPADWKIKNAYEGMGITQRKLFIFNENNELVMQTESPTRGVAPEPMMSTEDGYVKTEIGEIGFSIYKHAVWFYGKNIEEERSFDIFVPVRGSTYQFKANEFYNTAFESIEDFQKERSRIENIVSSIKVESI